MTGERSRRRWEVLFLLVVPFLYLGPILLSGRVFLPQVPAGLEPFRSEDPAAAQRALQGANYVESDRLFPFLTDQMAIRAALRDGEWPAWEPSLGLGMPLIAQSIAGVAYPPNWLAFAFPPERMAAPLAFLSLFLAGLGMWLFLGRLGLSTGARVFGALALQLGGWGTANLFYYMKVDAALWLPWALWAVEGLARGKRWSGAALAVALAASLVAGMISVSMFVCAATALYAVARLLLPARWLGVVGETGTRPHATPLPPIVAAVVFMALGVVVSAVFLWPLLECKSLGERALADPGRVAQQSLPLGTVCGTVVCDFVGAPTEATPTGRLPVAWWITPASELEHALSANQLEWNTYAGAAVVVLALLGALAVPHRAIFPGLLLLGTFGFAQGWPLFSLAYSLPGLNVGAPGRVLALAWVLWPWLAALGVDAWVTGNRRAPGALFAIAFVACSVAFAAWARFDPAGWAERLEATMIERYGEIRDVHTTADVRAVLPYSETIAAGERLQSSLRLFLGSSLALLGAAVIGLIFGRASAPLARRAQKVRFALASFGILILVLLLPASRALAAGDGTPPALLAVVGTVLLGLLAWWRFSPLETPRWLPLLFVLLAEGVVAAQGHVSGRDLEGRPVFPPSPTIEAIRTAAAGARVIRYDPSESGVADVADLARPNMLQMYGISDVSAWVLFTTRDLNALFEAVDPRTRWRQGISRIPSVDLVGHPVLDLTRIGAVLSREPIQHPRLEPVLEREGFCVYHRTGAFGPARLVPQAIEATSDAAALLLLASGAVDFELSAIIAPESAAALHEQPEPTGPSPGTIARYARPARGRIEIDVTGSDGGWLVVHEQFYPGWRARVNDAPARILRADHVYQAVRVPAGDSTVVLRYAPGSLRWAPLVSAAGLLAALFLSRRLAA